jgi:21S rRNA (uridine2791-2'-O)-methyltransferase
MAALSFCFTTLHTGGHFVCKYYSGGDDKNLEKRLKALFEKVHREKPEASRPVSKRLVSTPNPF